MSEDCQQMVQKLKREIELLINEVNTKEKLLKAQKQSSDYNQTHIQTLRAKNQAQKQKITTLEAALNAANSQKDKLRDKLAHAELKLAHAELKLAEFQNRKIQLNSSIFGSHIKPQLNNEISFPSFVGQNSFYDMSRKNEQPAPQNNRSSQMLSDSKIFAEMEQKFKELTTKLELTEKQREVLKEKIAKLESEKKQSQKMIKLQTEKIAKLENQHQKNVTSQLISEVSRDSLAENRKLYLDGNFVGQSILISPKQVHEPVFTALMNHFNALQDKKKVSFLNMLNVWADQRLQRIYKTFQNLT